MKSAKIIDISDDFEKINVKSRLTSMTVGTISLHKGNEKSLDQ